MESAEDGHVIYYADTDLSEVNTALEAELDLEGMEKLIDALEDDGDVQRMTASFEASDEVTQSEQHILTMRLTLAI